MFKFLIGKNVNKFINIPTIFIPIILFILFDAVALCLNFAITEKLEKSTLTINLSGRQRMLSQQMTKSLLMVQRSNIGIQKQTAVEEFSKTVDLFDKTLSAFSYGGETLNGQGIKIFMPAIEETSGKFITYQALQIWLIVQKKLISILELGVNVDEVKLTAGLDILLYHNIQLLKLMNDLTSVIEQKAYQDIFRLRIAQAGILILAFLNFIIFLYFLLRQFNQFKSNLQSINSIIDSIETSILIFDNNGIIYSTNKAANKVFGIHDNSLIGKPISNLIFNDGNVTFGKRLDKSVFLAKVNIQTLHEFNKKISLCTIIDTTEQNIREKELRKLAFYDPLTGLPNRLLLLERLSQELSRAKRESSVVAVMFVDLDGFKAVNDVLGHLAGDELLRLVSNRFQQNCRAIDTVARLGGDEFVFVLSSLNSVTDIKKIAQNILWATSQTFLIGEQTVNVGCSIGIAFYPDNGTDADLLLKHADEAMYDAKRNGKNAYVFFLNPNDHETGCIAPANE